MEHTQTVNQLEDVLLGAGYTHTFEEAYGEGMRTLYRKGDSNIFIEHILKDPIEIDPEDSDVEIDTGDDYEDLTINLID